MTLDPRYPLGPAPKVDSLTPAERHDGLVALRALPDEFAAALAGLNATQLDTPYREGGWTVRQLAHHLADSHLNAYVRTKLALTEAEPKVKPYDERLWAQLGDSRLDPQVSLALLRPLHQRWVTLLKDMNESDWQNRFLHPVTGPNSLDQMLCFYSWHGRHHTAHVTRLRERMDW